MDKYIHDVVVCQRLEYDNHMNQNQVQQGQTFVFLYFL